MNKPHRDQIWQNRVLPDAKKYTLRGMGKAPMPRGLAYFLPPDPSADRTFRERAFFDGHGAHDADDSAVIKPERADAFAHFWGFVDVVDHDGLAARPKGNPESIRHVFFLLVNSYEPHSLKRHSLHSCQSYIFNQCISNSYVLDSTVLHVVYTSALTGAFLERVFPKCPMPGFISPQSRKIAFT